MQLRRPVLLSKICTHKLTTLRAPGQTLRNKVQHFSGLIDGGVVDLSQGRHLYGNEAVTHSQFKHFEGPSGR